MTAISHPGEFLRLWRIRAGLTQKEVAKRTGYTVNFISLIERGINKPNDQLLCKLADLYNLDVDEVFKKFGKLPPAVHEELQTNDHLRKTLLEIVTNEKLSEEDKQKLYKRIGYWYQEMLKEKKQ